MRRLIFTLAMLGVVAALPAHAQVASIDPGMTRAQVVEALGSPVGERQSGTYTYLFYRNGCEIKCGMQDLVILEGDAVVDAIFRSPNRTYNGASSSPTGVTPEASGAGRERGTGTINISPASSTTTGQSSGGGIVTATPSPTPVPPAATPSAGPGSTGVSNRPAAPATNPAATTANPMTAGPTTGGARPSTTVPPLSPRDTSNVQPNRTTQGQLTPPTKDAAPVPFTGSKPNPRDSAEKARAGQRPDSTKPPED